MVHIKRKFSETVQISYNVYTADDLLENFEHLEELKKHPPKSKQGRDKLNFYEKQFQQWDVPERKPLPLEKD